MSILEPLTTGKWVLISHYMWAKIILVLELASRISRREPVLIIDQGNLLTPERLAQLLIRGDQEKIMITDKNIAPQGINNLIILEPPVFPWKLHTRNILVTTTPGSGLKIPKYYRKAYLKKIHEDLYQLTMGNESFRIVIRNGRIQEKVAPPGRLGEAYEILKEAMLEYGELTAKDATIILEKEMDITRDEARKILSDLLLKKYIRIVHGKINLV